MGQHITTENVVEQIRSFKAKFDDLLQDLQKLAIENEKTAQMLNQKEELIKQTQSEKTALSA